MALQPGEASQSSHGDGSHTSRAGSEEQSGFLLICKYLGAAMLKQAVFEMYTLVPEIQKSEFYCFYCSTSCLGSYQVMEQLQ